MYAVRFILPDCERDLSEWLHNAYEQGGENAVIPLHSHTLSSTHPVSLNMNIIFRGQFRPYTFVNSLPLVFWSGAECNKSSVFLLCGGESKSSLSLSSHRLSLSYQINMISRFHPCVLAWTLAQFIHPFIFALNTEHRESHFIFRLPQYCLVANTSSVLKTVSSMHLLRGSFYPCWAHWNKSTTPATLATTTSMLQLKPKNDAKPILLSQLLPKHPPHAAVKMWIYLMDLNKAILLFDRDACYTSTWMCILLKGRILPRIPYCMLVHRFL